MKNTSLEILKTFFPEIDSGSCGGYDLYLIFKRI